MPGSDTFEPLALSDCLRLIAAQLRSASQQRASVPAFYASPLQISHVTVLSMPHLPIILPKKEH